MNGWIAPDLLDINANQLAQLGDAIVSLEGAVTTNAAAIVEAQNQARDDRIAYLVVLAVLAVVVGATQPGQRWSRQTTSSGDGIAPSPPTQDGEIVAP